MCELDPGGDSPGHGDGVPTQKRHRIESVKTLGFEGLGRATGRIQAVQPPARPDQGEGVGPDPVAGRLDDGQGHGGRNRSVDGVASIQHHAKPSLGCERLGGRHDIPGQHCLPLR